MANVISLPRGRVVARNPDFDGVIAFGSTDGPKSRVRVVRISEPSVGAYQRIDGTVIEPGAHVEDPATGRHGYFGGVWLATDGSHYFDLRRWPTEAGRRKVTLPFKDEGALLERLRLRFEYPYAIWCD